jgi:hypothetical protein
LGLNHQPVLPLAPQRALLPALLLDLLPVLLPVLLLAPLPVLPLDPLPALPLGSRMVDGLITRRFSKQRQATDMCPGHRNLYSQFESKERVFWRSNGFGIGRKYLIDCKLDK